MIIVKDNREQMIISMVRNTGSYCKMFSIAVQNTITKEIAIFTTEDIGNDLYMKFNLNLSNLENGEYYVLIFENENSIPFYTSPNNPSEVTYFKYVASEDNVIMNGDFYIVMEAETEVKITYIQTELLRIGEYKNPSTQYNKEQTYKTYKG